jgi:hypothetical protein
MRTTINMSDALLRQVKKAALEANSTAEALARRRSKNVSLPVELITYGTGGQDLVWTSMIAPLCWI